MAAFDLRDGRLAQARLVGELRYDSLLLALYAKSDNSVIYDLAYILTLCARQNISSLCANPNNTTSRAIRTLAVNHQGIALLAEKIVEEDLASGRLRRVLPEWQGTSVSIYTVTETRLLPAKTQRFIEFLSARLTEA
ncbi:LysR substrate-binding domain-containing protein [Sphingomonas sp. DT-204]|uniref:LysR substrate-binding domain-containing protein n=1 Tax=Sphingomonas sp. DT-204 TaxID=3396166 RepID=UPI003F1E0DF3